MKKMEVTEPSAHPVKPLYFGQQTVALHFITYSITLALPTIWWLKPQVKHFLRYCPISTLTDPHAYITFWYDKQKSNNLIQMFQTSRKEKWINRSTHNLWCFPETQSFVTRYSENPLTYGDKNKEEWRVRMAKGYLVISGVYFPIDIHLNMAKLQY